VTVARRYPVTRGNSTVCGHGARSKGWGRWWNDRADWANAVPVCSDGNACLNVPNLACDGYGAGDYWYRVRPRRKGKTRAVRDERGAWFWEYS
jgi:hypothetical protein